MTAPPAETDNALLESYSQLSDGLRRPRGSARLRAFVLSDGFGHASLGLVIINMVLMCMGYAGMSDEYAARLELIATVITLLFVAEMGLKLCALGCGGYWTDGWNQLDGTIVIVSLFDLGLTLAQALGVLGGGNSANMSFLRILRMLRLLRILRLMKSWRGLYNIVMTLLRSLPQMGNMMVLMGLMLCMFALLGMQLFGGAFDEEHGYGPDGAELPRYHFDYFGPALLTCLIIMTGSWYDATVAAVGVGGPSAALFFVLVVVVGCYLILNLFIAIVLHTFASSTEEDDEDPFLKRGRTSSRSSAGGSRSNSPEGRRNGRSPSSRVSFKWEGVPWAAPVDNHPAADVSIGLFGPQSRVRRLATALAFHPRFDNFIIVVIVVSSICLAIDSPRLDPTSTLAITLSWLDLVWTAIFAFECIVKVISLGFVCNGKRSYLRDPWNVLDFCIVVISVVVLLGIPQLKSLRTAPAAFVPTHQPRELDLLHIVLAQPESSELCFMPSCSTG